MLGLALTTLFWSKINFEDQMDRGSYLKVLQTKHSELDKKILQQQKEGFIDNLNIIPLKKEKLKLKEEINRYYRIKA